MLQMFIQVAADKLEMATLQHGVLDEYYSEDREEQVLVGNLYLGRVMNVLPGMQSAFIDIGLAKNAYLYIDDLLHPNLDKQPQQKPDISELVRPGQILLVQIVKQPSGTKGAKITTHINLPGRLLVYMPNADYVAASKKITNEQVKESLLAVVEKARKEEEGIILRTLAAEQSETAIIAEIDALRKLWKQVNKYVKSVVAPALVHSEAELLYRVIRDRLHQHYDEIWIDDMEKYEFVKILMQQFNPGMEHRVKWFERRLHPTSLFASYGVSEQLVEAISKRVLLPSGGYIVWEETEAMTVIDVNTGKYVGTENLEQTVFDINLEAAELIARLLRIRDAGGIIIIDFIDMSVAAHRQRVLLGMEHAVQRDGKKCTVVGWTKLGLMELTRKKVRTTKSSRLVNQCPKCGVLLQ
ncbi:Rne/Rng family ribonuclease [Paenibacillus yanchengensis]|uniref:Rne/Rng family ribonuclease n=1 Tax=Paenibacillus yanchengensis TaxID=2035833 RepID=A0ABW4YL60_9BACL